MKLRLFYLLGIVLLLFPHMVLADGIDVISPTGSSLSRGGETVVKYRFIEPHWPNNTHVRIYLHHQHETFDEIGMWRSLWEGRPPEAYIDENNVVSIPTSISDEVELDDDYVLTVLFNSDLWGRIGPFEIINPYGDSGGYEVAGNGVLMSYPSGGESWSRGTQYSITWLVIGFRIDEDEDYIPQATFDIEILRSGMGLVRLRPPESGWDRLQCDQRTYNTHRCSASWVVPNDEAERYMGDDITIKVNATATDGTIYSDVSEPFSIRAGGIALREPPKRWPNRYDPDSSSRTEETYYIAHDFDVRWRVTTLESSDVIVNLLDETGAITNITNGGRTNHTTHFGDFSWELGRPSMDILRVTPGSGYRIRVETLHNSSIYDESIPFAIALPVVSVQTPNGGSFYSDEFTNDYVRDENMDINWTAENLTDSHLVDVAVTVNPNIGATHCHAPVGQTYVLRRGLPATSGHFSWDIDSELPVGSSSLPEQYDLHCYPLDIRIKVKLQDYENHISGETSSVLIHNR